MSAPRRVFVVMPFSGEFDDVYGGIKRACEAAGVACSRVDEQIFDQGILERIFAQIESADLIIGEMSLHNPNVYFEIGYAKGVRKKVLLIARNADAIPFDLRNLRHVIYDGKVEKLEKVLPINILELLRSTSDLGPRKIAGIWQGEVWDEHPDPKYPRMDVRMDFTWAGRVEGSGSVSAGGHDIPQKFLGDFLHDRYLMLDYTGLDPGVMQFGAALLRLNGTGNQLDGRYLGYGAVNDTMVYGRVNLAKKSTR